MLLPQFNFLLKPSKRKSSPCSLFQILYFFHCFKQSVYNIPNCKQLLSLTFFFLIYCLSFFPSLQERKSGFVCAHPPLLLVYWQTRIQSNYIVAPHMQYLTPLLPPTLRLRHLSEPETRSICPSICLISAGQPATSRG